MSTRIGGVTSTLTNKTAASQQIESSSKCKLIRFSYDLTKSIPKQVYLVEGIGTSKWKAVSYESLKGLSATNPFLIFCDDLNIVNFDNEKIAKLFTNLNNFYTKTEIELSVIEVK